MRKPMRWGAFWGQKHKTPAGRWRFKFRFAFGAIRVTLAGHTNRSYKKSFYMKLRNLSTLFLCTEKSSKAEIF